MDRCAVMVETCLDHPKVEVGTFGRGIHAILFLRWVQILTEIQERQKFHSESGEKTHQQTKTTQEKTNLSCSSSCAYFCEKNAFRFVFLVNLLFWVGFLKLC